MATGKQPALLAHAWMVWLGVALVLVTYKAATYRSFARFARAGAVAVSQGRLRDLYLDEQAVGCVKRPPPLFVNELIRSPMLVGLLRPAIILPPLDAGEDELRHILRHELTHYKRLDGLYKWLAQLVLCLHWFNPLVYLAARQLGKACELACDEAVVKRLDAGGRIGYGNALIASLRAQGGYSSSVISVTMSEDAGIIRERLDAIAGTVTDLPQPAGGGPPAISRYRRGAGYCRHGRGFVNGRYRFEGAQIWPRIRKFAAIPYEYVPLYVSTILIT